MSSTIEVSHSPENEIQSQGDFSPDKVTSYELFGFVSKIMDKQMIHKKRQGIPKESRVSVLLNESIQKYDSSGLLEKTMNAFTIPDDDDRSIYRKMVRVALLLHPNIVDSQNLLLNTMFYTTNKSAQAGTWIFQTRLAHYLLSLPELKDQEDEIKRYVLSTRDERKKMKIHDFFPAKFTCVVEHPTLMAKNGHKMWITQYEKNELHNRFRILEFLRNNEKIWTNDQKDVSILDALIPLWQ